MSIIQILLKPFGWCLRRLGYAVRIEATLPAKYQGIRDANLYQPLFSPWLGGGQFEKEYARISEFTLVSKDRCWILDRLARQAMHVPGAWIECGVFRGGTAMMLAKIINEQDSSDRHLHLFDTFSGMPETDPEKDLHKAGDFASTSVDEVRQRLAIEKNVSFHPGWIPETFLGLDLAPIAFAHIDVDVYRSIIDCCEYIYPRLRSGAVMVFDDYGFASCPGARQAVDDFFRNRDEEPLCLMTGQALVIKC